MFSNTVSMPGTTANATKGLILLIALAIVVAFLGGSSNPRVPQLVGLRPLAALFLIPIIYYWRAPASTHERTLAMLLLGVGAWMLVQLIPLPQSIWGSMPDRQLIVDLDAAVGLGAQWRPISWVPSRGVNALFSLIVPATALLLAMVLRARNETLLQILLGVVLLNGVLAIIQVVSGNPEGAYMYNPRSSGSDGLFGNENHSGVLMAIGLLIAARLASQPRPRHQRWQQLVYGIVGMVIFLSVLIGGSRAGLAAGVGATVGALFMLYLANRHNKPPKRTGSRTAKAPLGNRSVLALSALLLAGMTAAFFWLDRSPSFDGILSESAFDDLRWQLNPVLLDMASRNWLLGTGFGSFEEYYHIYEPTNLLLPKFINLAHNDWAQLVIEGGVVAVILLAMLLGWAGKQLARIVKEGAKSFHLIVFWFALFGLVAAASLVDYPLRTPIFQFVLVWLLLCLARDGTGSELAEPQAARSKSRSGK